MRPQGLLDIARLGDFLAPHQGPNQASTAWTGVSPLSVPILLEIGRGGRYAGILRVAPRTCCARRRRASSTPRRNDRGTRMLELKPERLAFDDFQDQHHLDLRQARSAPTCRARSTGRRGRADRRRPAPGEGLGAMPRAGSLLPPYDTRETLQRLAAVIDRYDAGTVIALGDSLHDVEASPRIGLEELEILQHHAGGPRVDLGHRQPRPQDRRASRRQRRRRHRGRGHRAAPRAAAGPRHARDRRPLHPAAALSMHGYVDAPAVLRRQRPPPGDAGVRHLRRRAQHSRRRRSSRCSATTACPCGCSARRGSTPWRRGSSRKTERSQAALPARAEAAAASNPADHGQQHGDHPVAIG